MATLVAPNVLVSMMSAPASRYWRWICSIASGWVIARMSMKFFRSLRVLGEPLAAKVGLAELQRVDHRAHGAVEHQNALRQEPFK